jgi:hypothetical protein
VEDLAKILLKDGETNNIFEQFKLIENIYNNSLIAMGYESYINNVPSNSNNFLLSNLEINTNKR